MKTGWVEKISGFVCNLVLLTLSISLIVAYGFLFKIFRPNSMEIRPASVPHQEEVRLEEEWAYQEPER